MTRQKQERQGESDSVVLCDVQDGVAELTLNRPDRLNAFTPQMGAALITRFRELDEDDSVRVIVVTGAGRAFCAGADLGGGKRPSRESKPVMTPTRCCRARRERATSSPGRSASRSLRPSTERPWASG